MNFVAHDCRNGRLPETILDKEVNGKKIYKQNPEYCNNRFIAEDLTGASTQIPTWRYCPECCKKLGIDYENQKPSDYRSDERNEKIKEVALKMQHKRKQNIQG